MSDKAVLQRGQWPWLPSEDSQAGPVLHRFTIPLIGFFDQGGCTYLYWCVVGHAHSESAWAYARVDADQVSALQEADAQEFDRLLRETVEGRVEGFAMASDDKGITLGIELDEPASAETVFQVGMAELHSRIAEVHDEYAALSEQLQVMRPPTVVPSPRETIDVEL